jgi:hypothetical protein
VLHSGRLQPCSQILDKAGKAGKGQHSSLLQNPLNYDRKSFIGLSPGVAVYTACNADVYIALMSIEMSVRSN